MFFKVHLMLSIYLAKTAGTLTIQGSPTIIFDIPYKNSDSLVYCLLLGHVFLLWLEE